MPLLAARRTRTSRCPPSASSSGQCCASPSSTPPSSCWRTAIRSRSWSGRAMRVQLLVIFVWMLPRMGAGLFRTPRLKLQLVRAALLPLSSLCFFSALKYLPLAEATAINYGTPILVIILAVIFLGERMTRPRIALVLAGIAGMFLIVRPGSVVFQSAALLGARLRRVLRRVPDPDAHARRRGFARASVLPGARRHGDADRAPAVARHRLRDADGRTSRSSAVAGLLGTFGHFLFILAFQRRPRRRCRRSRTCSSSSRRSSAG